MLLFSKTGIQHPFTNPENPRALYFNDRVVVGYIPGAPVIEIASHDPRQGVIFQTLKQDGVKPDFARPDRCLTAICPPTVSSVPGILVRSMFTERHRAVRGRSSAARSSITARRSSSGGAAGMSPARTVRSVTWAMRW